MPRPLHLVLALAFASAWFAPASARGQTCTFTTGPTALAFGAYDPATAAPLDSTGRFRFACSNPAIRPTVMLAAGSGTFATRQMTQGTDRLDYNLFQDAARTVIWGDGTPPSSPLLGARPRTRYTIYGRIPAGQYPRAGPYADTITITLLY